MAKRSKKGDFLDYAYFVLYDNWPKVSKKLGIDKDAISTPNIKLVKGDSEYSDSDPELISINYQTTLNAYKKKNKVIQGLEIKCEDILKDDIIHECVHYIQDEFYNIHSPQYSYATEGLASLVTVEIQLEDENYEVAATAIAEYFIEMKRRYKDYFGLPEKYNKHIEEVIKCGIYMPTKRDLDYAKGFMHICENTGLFSNYLHLLIEPFENSDVDI